ncbi:SDR family oxidoreductase [Candidatus Woesearchaeota archaeon]|nr:SDR family oxidoreductase [Candidatus Woesearchaeota archaeon]
MSRILITGGAGFIGSNLAHQLVKEGSNEVLIIDNLSAGKKENLLGIEDKLKFYENSILDLAKLREITKGVDYILHHAAIPSVAKSVDNPLPSHEVNTTGTLNVLIAAKENKVKRVIFASSSSVYGNQNALYKHEGLPTQPLSPYATQKLTSENYCKNFYDLYSLPIVILRYFNVFGPRQDPNSEYSAAIPAILKKVLNNQQPIIYGDGTQSRDFTFVDNVVKANILACESDNAPGEIFNIATGGSVSVNDLVFEITQLTGKNLKPLHVEPRKGEVLNSTADISKAERLLDYTSRVPFIQGLDATVEWYKKGFSL